MQTYNEKRILDYTGAAVAWICAVHCLAMPFLITFLSVIGLSFLADETTEWIIILSSLAIALFSLIPSFRQHRKYQSLLLFTFGIGMILTSHLFFEDEFIWNIPLVLTGAISITSAHLLNRYYCKNCQLCKLNEMEKA